MAADPKGKEMKEIDNGKSSGLTSDPLFEGPSALRNGHNPCLEKADFIVSDRVLRVCWDSEILTFVLLHILCILLSW